MARIRTIKPEFPQSESMGRISRDARLLFIELWTICDDSGRTRAASRMLASFLFPYDDDAPGLIDGWLTELEREGCIVRYVAKGATYLQILNWLNHQKIDKPSKSKIPEFVESSRILSKPRECSSLDQGPRTKDQGEDLKAQGTTSPLSPTSVDDAEAEAGEGESGSAIPQCPHAEILKLFAEKLPELPQPRRSLWAESKNAEALRARWRWVMTTSHEDGPHKGQPLAATVDEGIAWFGRFFDFVRKCPLLMGAKGDWQADLGWLVNKNNFAKVVQGNYQEKAA